MALHGVRSGRMSSTTSTIGMMTAREYDSLTRLSLGWAWNDAKHAALLAAELLRWALPPPQWVTMDDPEVAAWNKRHAAEEPVGDSPYRTPGDQRVNVDAPEVIDARFEVTNVITYLALFGEGRDLTVPSDVGRDDEHPMTKLYWYAEIMGKRIEQTCALAAHTAKDVNLCMRWNGVGNAAKNATEFIRKFATNNPVIGSVDGAAGGILNRISMTLAYAGKPTEEIVGRVLHWRVKDALKGRELAPELDANLRPAFEAAWSAGEYEFAYSLLADLDTLAEP